MQKLENKEAASDSVKVTLIVVSTVIVLAVVALAVFLNLRPGTTITTNWQSTIKATPDLVSIYFTVDTNCSTAQEAKDKNAEIVDNVIQDL